MTTQTETDYLDDLVGTPEAQTIEVEGVKEAVSTPEAEAQKEPEDPAEKQPEQNPTEPEKKPEPESQKTVPVEALMDERRKRQELEQRLREVESNEQPKNEFWDNPEQYLANMQHNIRCEVSEELAKTKYSDYDEKFQKFAEMANSNPMLRAELANSKNPAEFVYNTAKNYMEVQEAGSIEDLKKKFKEEALAQARAELGLTQKKTPPEPPQTILSSPGSLDKRATPVATNVLDELFP